MDLGKLAKLRWDGTTCAEVLLAMEVQPLHVGEPAEFRWQLAGEGISVEAHEREGRLLANLRR